MKQFSSIFGQILRIFPKTPGQTHLEPTALFLSGKDYFRLQRREHCLASRALSASRPVSDRVVIPLASRDPSQ